MSNRTMIVAVCLVFAGLLLQPTRAEQPPNIILFIGDGMGQMQVDTASLYRHGRVGALRIDQLPVRSTLSTESASSRVTDSAASATAIATGRKVNNGVLSVAIPGDGADLPTIFDVARRQGYTTGLVTTTHLTHATPAAFVAKQAKRSEYAAIGRDMLTFKPLVMLGGGGFGLSPEMAEEAGYDHVVTDKHALRRLANEQHVVSGSVAGLFGEDHLPFVWYEMQAERSAYEDLPHLRETTAAAVRILQQHQPYILMVEGGRIDHACHGPRVYEQMKPEERLPLCVHETLAFDDAVAEALKLAGDQTLIVVTADHETGGMAILQPGKQGRYSTVTWSTHGHTDVQVPLRAIGPGSEHFAAPLDNTDIFHRLNKILGGAPESAKGADKRSAAD
jgi:alkaline phosphatase